MAQPTLDIAEITRRLTEASAMHDGVRYVRASVACKTLGLADSFRWSWERRGLIQPLRLRCPRSRAASRGVVVAWPLDQVIDAYAAGRPRAYTAKEIEFIQEKTGVLPLDAIAERLGRSAASVRDKQGQLGLTRRNAQGLLTTGEAARLCGRTRAAVNDWCLRMGLRYERLGSGQREKLIDPADLAVFLKARPRVFGRLTPKAQQRVRAFRTSYARQPREAA
ncbi:MAG: hypothetical protein AAF333_13200 [Planctomycetota bacterium]